MPAAKIDPVDFEKLCALQCTHEEIAAWFNVCRKTITRLLKQPKFAELMERGKAKGRISIKRALMKAVDAGNITAIIWAGKIHLGYRDSVDAQITGKDGGPIEYLSIVLPRIQEPSA